MHATQCHIPLELLVVSKDCAKQFDQRGVVLSSASRAKPYFQSAWVGSLVVLMYVIYFFYASFTAALSPSLSSFEPIQTLAD